MHNGIAVIKARRFRRAGGTLLAGLLFCAAGGCLNLGGKTTYVQENPETEARISSLEARIGTLEQAVSTSSTVPQYSESGDPSLGRSNDAPPPYGQQDDQAR